EYQHHFTTIIKQYEMAGFKVKFIHGDGEFHPMFNSIRGAFDAILNTANPGDHVPEAERNNRTIEERFRATFHRLPYTAWPKLMIRSLALQSVLYLNIFPAKGGISQHYSPHQILHLRHFDYEKHCKYEFGSYVTVNNPLTRTNTNDSRSLDAIYLRPTGNLQGGHTVMDLETGAQITRAKVTGVYPITPAVEKRVNTLGAREGFQDLYFKNRKGQFFPDTDWLAGVDYDENDENDEYEDANEEAPEDNDDNEDNDDDDADDNDEDDNDDDDNNDDDNDDADNADTEDEDDDQAEGSNQPRVNEVPPGVRRSTRAPKPVQRMNMAQLEVKHNLFTNINAEEKNTTYYDSHMTIVIARLIQFFNDMSFIQQAFSFGQQYMLQKGLKVFGQRGYDAAEAEIHQLHDRVCFKPVSVAKMTAEEKRKAMEALMFLTEKRPDLEGNTKVKGRMVYNGKPTREWLSREDSASPTVSTESLFLTAVIEAVEERDVMTADIPNAFIQAPMPEVREGEPRVMMKITGVLVDMLVSIDADLYGPFIVFDRGRKVLYVQVLLAIYGQLVASLRWFLTFSKDLEGIGFEFNPYDPCVANRMVNGSQQTILFHVDDLKSSHVDPAVNDEFAEWLQGKYGKHKKLEPQRGKQHEYLGMILDYTEKGKVKIDMRRYVADMIEDFPVKLRESDKSAYPASEDLFGQHQEDDTMLSKTMAEGYHSTVAKGLFLSKRSRPDIQPSIAYLSTRVKAPTQTDWKKLVKMMKFLNATRED
ncbi:MAG: hypothetical protein AAFR36_31085, partial [Bacteroidota bacterium]